jgi:hypothetical protein
MFWGSYKYKLIEVTKSDINKGCDINRNLWFYIYIWERIILKVCYFKCSNFNEWCLVWPKFDNVKYVASITSLQELYNKMPQAFE